MMCENLPAVTSHSWLWKIRGGGGEVSLRTVPPGLHSLPVQGWERQPCFASLMGMHMYVASVALCPVVADESGSHSTTGWHDQSG